MAFDTVPEKIPSASNLPTWLRFPVERGAGRGAEAAGVGLRRRLPTELRGLCCSAGVGPLWEGTGTAQVEVRLRHVKW